MIREIGDARDVHSKRWTLADEQEQPRDGLLKMDLQLFGRTGRERADDFVIIGQELV